MDGDIYKMPDEEFNLFDAQTFMLEHDCYISKQLMNADGSISRDILDQCQEFPLDLRRGINTHIQSRLVVTILAFDSNHALEIVDDDFQGWKIQN